MTLNRYLIDGAGDETRKISDTFQRDAEGGGKGWRGLDSGEGTLPNIRWSIEAEDRPSLIIRRALLNLEDRRIHVLNIIQIREYERLLNIEATSNDVLRILVSQSTVIMSSTSNNEVKEESVSCCSVNIISIRMWSHSSVRVPGWVSSRQPRNLFGKDKTDLWQSSSFSSCLNRNFSSSVSWMTNGQSKTSWSHFVMRKGTMCPRCSDSEEGPRPVYR